MLVTLKLMVFPASTPAPGTVSNGWVNGPLRGSSEIVPGPIAKMEENPEMLIPWDEPAHVEPPPQLMQMLGEAVTPTSDAVMLAIAKLPLSLKTKAVAVALVGAKAKPVKAVTNVAN